jgi:hypothetical protein
MGIEYDVRADYSRATTTQYNTGETRRYARRAAQMLRKGDGDALAET